MLEPACIPIDWTDSVTAVVAALVALGASYMVHYRPPGSRTRRDDGAPLEDPVGGLAASPLKRRPGAAAAASAQLQLHRLLRRARRSGRGR